MRKFGSHLDNVRFSSIRAIGDRIREMEAEGRKVVRLQIGEPDFSSPQHIIDAAIKSLENKDTHYAPNRGILPLRQAIAEKLKKDNGLTYDPDTEIMVMNGCAEALYCGIVGTVAPGEEVIIIEPAFLSYEQIIRLAGAVPVTVTAKEENNWYPAKEDLEAAITDKTRMIVINSPCNPTGVLYPRETMQDIADLAIKYDLLVASDEVYEKLRYEGEHVAIASLDGMFERTITINGLSKAYAMTGWRMGYTAAPKNLTQLILKVHQYAATCLPVFSQKGAIDALKNSDEDVEAMRKEYNRRRDILCEYFDACPNITYTRTQATFYMYINIAKSGMKSKEFCARLLEEKGVAIVPDSSFVTEEGTCCRLSFASSEEALRAGAKAICDLAMGK